MSELVSLETFEKFVEEYSQLICPQIKKNNRIESILNYSYKDLISFSETECLSFAYELCSFLLMLDKELSENKAKLDWCIDSLNYICSKEWNNYDNYLKYEIKRQCIINDNSFAQKIELSRSKLQCMVTLLESRILEIRKMIQILEEISRRKAFR